MRSAVLFVLGLILAGCATLPEVNPWTDGAETPGTAGTPRLVGARGPLTPAQAHRVFARLQ
jgi:hypothetical protein